MGDIFFFLLLNYKTSEESNELSQNRQIKIFYHPLSSIVQLVALEYGSSHLFRSL